MDPPSRSIPVLGVQREEVVTKMTIVAASATCFGWGMISFVSELQRKQSHDTGTGSMVLLAQLRTALKAVDKAKLVMFWSVSLIPKKVKTVMRTSHH